MLRSSSFKHYRINQGIIERLELDPCTVSDTVTGSSVDPPYTRHTIKINGISERKKRRNERIIKELEARCAEVDEAIATMEDRWLAQILLLRYVEGMDWDDVSKQVYYNADYCRKKSDKYLHSLDEVKTEGFNKRTVNKARGFK